CHREERRSSSAYAFYGASPHAHCRHLRPRRRREGRDRDGVADGRYWTARLADDPRRGAAFLVIPSLVTNLWQFLAGRHRVLLLRRMWRMLLAISVATWVGAGLIAGVGATRARMFLGWRLPATPFSVS